MSEIKTNTKQKDREELAKELKRRESNPIKITKPMRQAVNK